MGEYTLERRTKMLTDAVINRTNIIRNALAPEGARPPFSTQLSKADALNFWQRNRHSAIGEQILQRMKPEDILKLDLALSEGQNGLQG